VGTHVGACGKTLQPMGEGPWGAYFLEKRGNMAKKKMSVTEEVEEAKKLSDFVTEVKRMFVAGHYVNHYVKQGDRHEFSMTKEYCRLEMDIMRNKRGLFDSIRANFLVPNFKIGGNGTWHSVETKAMSIEFVDDVLGKLAEVNDRIAEFASSVPPMITALSEVDYGRGEDN